MRHARRCLTFSVLTLLTASLTVGCVSGGDGTWSLHRALAGPGYVDSTEMPDEEWVSDAGATGRKGRAVEVSNDPLNLREIFMSEKARSIERNVGIE